MSLDRIAHARHLLADAGDLLTADPSKLYWLARQVQPLLDLLDGAGYSRELERGAPVVIPVKPCCGLLVSDVCDCAAFAASAEAALASPLPAGWSR